MTNQADNAPFEFSPQRYASWLTIAAVTIALLVLGKSLLVPFAIAVFVWILLNAIKTQLDRLVPGDGTMPAWLGNTLAILITIAATYASILVITSQSDELVAAIPNYQANFAALVDRFRTALGVAELPTSENLLNRLDLAAILSWVGNSVTALMSDVVLIAIYVGFLLAEQHVLPTKIRHLYTDPEKAEQVSQLATHVADSIQRYIGMKTIISIATAAVSYAILMFVGVDFAAIWALLVFFLNFIPTIGSIIAAIFPALLTLVQFDTITPFIIVAVTLGGTQFLFGNIIEPAFMGRSLNLSSLMILLSLSFWGIVWGLAGMFLSVPIMVMTGIVCAQFKGLRWIAVILSVDGEMISPATAEESSETNN